MGDTDSNGKRRVAMEYLCDITGEEEQDIKTFLEALEGDFPLPVQSIVPYYTITTSGLANYPDGAIMLYDKDLNVFLSGGEQLGHLLTGTAEQGPGTPNFHFNQLFDEDTRKKVEPFFRKALNCEHHEELLSYLGFHFRVITYPVHVNDHGEVEAGVAVIRNVTEEEQRRQRLEEMLEERESMVKEIHHRVKNNLAVVTGLLELQSLQSRSEETRRILEESQNRVQSIATLHEKLYQTGDFRNIDIDGYFSDLIQHLQQTAVPDGKKIEIEYDIEAFEVPAKKAVSCGLILNEVITNASKHAFKDRDRGTIRVDVSHRKDDQTLELNIIDDGTGIPKDLEIEQLDSLGMRLIDTLAAQIGGKYSFKNTEDGGTHFSLVCKREG